MVRETPSGGTADALSAKRSDDSDLERVMTRGRICIVAALRLSVYGAALIAVRHAAEPAAAARLVLSGEGSALDLTGPLLAVLLLGILLEALSGAARWR